MQQSSKIQKRIAQGLLAGFIFVLSTLFAAAITPTAAFAQADLVDCADNEVAVSVSINDQNCVPEQGSIMALLTEVIRFLTIGVGIATVGGITYGGIVYIWARDNASQAKQGIDIITNTVIGLFLYVFMFAILNFLIPGGVFT